MSTEHVEILVEEASMGVALSELLPGLLGGVSFDIHVFQGKHDLLAKLGPRLRGHASSLPKTWQVLVVVDRDNDDCHDLKARLESAAHSAGLITRSRAKRGSWSVVNRIAIEELEAWFFGDADALRAAFPRVPAHLDRKAPFRDPDAIAGGTCEALARVLQRAGYFSRGLRKIEAARAIAQHMDPERNRSRSFQVVREVVREMAGG